MTYNSEDVMSRGLETRTIGTNPNVYAVSGNRFEVPMKFLYADCLLILLSAED
jgi:hypothetical protein